MAGQYDLSLAGDRQAAKDLVTRVLGEQGFTLETNPNGSLTAKRGSAGMTVLLGGLAGKNLQMTFFVEFLDGSDGNLVARLSRNTAAGALKGGAIGAGKTNNAFVDLVNAIAAAAQAAGVFVTSAAA
ncbi:MAG TPA: hypothetical protein VGF80_07560 [Galbitalea sp.]